MYRFINLWDPEKLALNYIWILETKNDLAAKNDVVIKSKDDIKTVVGVIIIKNV